MKAIDFFCGAGGLTRGLLDAGFDVVAGFDIDEQCKESYEVNNETAFHSHDVRDIDLKKLKSLTRIRKFENVLFAGGCSGHLFKHGPIFGEFTAGVACRDYATANRFKIGPRKKLSPRESPSGR